MPSDIRHLFKKKEGGQQKHIRFRNGVYEIRLRYNGIDISASSKSKREAKAKFIEKLQAAADGQQVIVPKTFTAFAMFYFENFRKRKVTERTYKNDLYRLKKHLIPYFKETPIKQITALSIQRFLDNLEKQGLGKTGDECHSLLNCTLKMAIAHRIISYNPMEIVFHQQHENDHGTALTRAEEKKLLSHVGKEFQKEFAVALYCGLRPNEYPSARIENGMVIALNSKRKNKKIEYKRIPISPMLRKYVDDSTVLRFFCSKKMWNELKRVLPDHKLYDLRTTFYTRCKECEIADAARDEMMGHSLGKLGNAYTDLSDDYLKHEIEKFSY